MIQIHIKETEKEVKEITISGHAGYSHAGNDMRFNMKKMKVLFQLTY